MIEISATTSASLEKAWECWTTPAHIMQWNAAIDEWHCPAATNDLRVGGTFSFTMAARDGSFSFDFGGTYTDVVPRSYLAYVLEDGRKVTVKFTETAEGTRVDEAFDPEGENPEDMQRQGWQAILNRFAAYAAS